MRRGDDVCRDRTLEVVHVSAENPVHEGREALAVLAFEIEAESLQRRMPVAIGDCPVKADADHGGFEEGNASFDDFAVRYILNQIDGPQSHGVVGDDPTVRQIQPG